jgi:hypothetical protein
MLLPIKVVSDKNIHNSSHVCEQNSSWSMEREWLVLVSEAQEEAQELNGHEIVFNMMEKFTVTPNSRGANTCFCCQRTSVICLECTY